MVKMSCLSKRHKIVKALVQIVCWLSMTWCFFGELYFVNACCTAYVNLAFSNCADHNCEGAMTYGAGCNGHTVYAPYGVCDNMDLLRNITDTWLSNYKGTDFNCDGIVNFQDFAIMLRLWSER
jgi:hypothetical protein